MKGDGVESISWLRYLIRKRAEGCFAESEYVKTARREAVRRLEEMKENDLEERSVQHVRRFAGRSERV